MSSKLSSEFQSNNRYIKTQMQIQDLWRGIDTLDNRTRVLENAALRFTRDGTIGASLSVGGVLGGIFHYAVVAAPTCPAATGFLQCSASYLSSASLAGGAGVVLPWVATAAGVVLCVRSYVHRKDHLIACLEETLRQTQARLVAVERLNAQQAAKKKADQKVEVGACRDVGGGSAVVGVGSLLLLGSNPFGWTLMAAGAGLTLVGKCLDNKYQTGMYK